MKQDGEDDAVDVMDNCDDCDKDLHVEQLKWCENCSKFVCEACWKTYHGPTDGSLSCAQARQR